MSNSTNLPALRAQACSVYIARIEDGTTRIIRMVVPSPLTAMPLQLQRSFRWLTGFVKKRTSVSISNLADLHMTALRFADDTDEGPRVIAHIVYSRLAALPAFTAVVEAGIDGRTNYASTTTDQQIYLIHAASTWGRLDALELSRLLSTKTVLNKQIDRDHGAFDTSNAQHPFLDAVAAGYELARTQKK